jgi:hypothetical protein
MADRVVVGIINNTHERLKKYCSEMGYSISGLVNRLILEHLDKHEKGLLDKFGNVVESAECQGKDQVTDGERVFDIDDPGI